MNPPPGYPGGPFPGMPPHMGMPPMGYPGAPPMGYPMGMPPPGYPYGVPMARPPYMGAPSPYPMGVPPVMPGMPPVHVALPPGPVGAPPPYVPPAGALPIRIGAAISAPPRLIGVETTVYVGRIPASATDDFIERLLQQCGKVANWKRMMDPISNTPRPFGFARFENEEGALRALRLLSNLEIDGNQLLLNVDDRTREALDRYQKSKAAIANIKEQQRQQRQQQEQQQKEQQQKEQQEQQQQQSADGDAPAPDGDKPADEPAAAAAVAEKASEEPAAEKEEEDVPDEVIVAKIKALLSDKKAGDFLKGMETGSAEDGDSAEATKREEERQASSSWDKELERERREREKDRAREREKRRGEREREARKRERDEREYREMEKDWETREREKERLRERREREEKKEREWQIEKELNYDEEEDRKRRKAGKRRKEREREEQDDEEDRRREVEEERARIEEERRRQEEELRRREEEAEAYRNSVAREAEEQRAGVKRSYDASLADDTENGLTPISPDSSDQRVKMGLRIAAPTLLKKPTKLGVTPGFNPDEEQNPLTNPKRKKLVPLEPMRTEEQIKKEREEEAKQIVAMIPAGKADLFNFQLSWDIVDEAEIVQKRMKPWVTKKIVEYLGEEEATLIEFVLAKMSNHMAPQEILDQLAFVLEDEAEVFVIKLWRMLIFETIRAQKAKERGVNIAA